MVDLRCPELADLETRLAGELVPVDDELYGLWCEHKGDASSQWWWSGGYSMTLWFTPDVRIAHAQQALLIIQRDRKWSTSTLEKVTVCRLGPKGEPLELD